MRLDSPLPLQTKRSAVASANMFTKHLHHGNLVFFYLDGIICWFHKALEALRLNESNPANVTKVFCGRPKLVPPPKIFLPPPQRWPKKTIRRSKATLITPQAGGGRQKKKEKTDQSVVFWERSSQNAQFVSCNPRHVRQQIDDEAITRGEDLPSLKPHLFLCLLPITSNVRVKKLSVTSLRSFHL